MERERQDRRTEVVERDRRVNRQKGTFKLHRDDNKKKI
jgi:hypothetical protein